MIRIAFGNLLRHRNRTAISLIGIVIGVVAIIGLVSMVDGLLSDVQKAFSQVQGIMVMQKDNPPYFSYINESLGDEIEKIPGVRVAVPEILTFANSVEDKPLDFGPTSTRLMGIDWSEQQRATSLGINGEIIKGRILRSGDSGFVVVGSAVLDDYDKFLGNKIKINGKNFTIVGVYETDSPLVNNGVFFAIDDLRDLTSFPKDKGSFFNINLVNPEDDQKIIKLIEFRFGESESISAYASSDLSNQFGEIISILRLLVIAVTGIAAIVAGIGIINTMLMSVVERFKEIGSLKAVGWTNSNIVLMVLYESTFIGLLGGTIGVILGYAVSISVGEAFGLTINASPMLLSQAFAFAVFIGIFAGIYPAYIASKMDPIAALRAE